MYAGTRILHRTFDHGTHRIWMYRWIQELVLYVQYDVRGERD